MTRRFRSRAAARLGGRARRAAAREGGSRAATPRRGPRADVSTPGPWTRRGSDVGEGEGPARARGRRCPSHPLLAPLISILPQPDLSPQILTRSLAFPSHCTQRLHESNPGGGYPGVGGHGWGRGRTPASTSKSPREEACHPALNSAKEVRGQTVGEREGGRKGGRAWGAGQTRNSPVARVPFQRHSSVLTAVPKSHKA